MVTVTNLSRLEQRLNYVFTNKQLLSQALTHRSFSSKHNERLEFLGDSVLNCVVASLLYERFAQIDEGDLSRLRASLVKQATLADIALFLDLPQFLKLGEGELKSGGFRRPSILADTLEAVIGAIYTDQGFDAASQVIASLYVSLIDDMHPLRLEKDAKTLLQEYLQGRRMDLPKYTVVATHGAAHNQEFEVACSIEKLDIQMVASGSSRRAAEQTAAKMVLDALETVNLRVPKRNAKKRKTTQLSLPVAVSQAVRPETPLNQSVLSFNSMNHKKD